MLPIGHCLEDILMSRDTIIFLLQHLAFVINWKKSVDTSKGNRVFGPDNQLCHSRTFFKQNEKTEKSFRMSEFVKQSANIDSGVDKVNWPVEDEECPGCETSPVSKRNMGLPSPMWDHSYCRMPSQQTERDSKFEVKKQFGLLGMEASSSVSENVPIEGNPRDFVEAGSNEPSSRCLPTKLLPQKSLRVSPFCMIPKVLSRAWPSQLWYPEAMRMSIQQPILLTWRKDLLKIQREKFISLSKISKLVAWTVSGLDYTRKEFQRRLPTFPLSQEDQVLAQIANRPGLNGLAVC